jgi:hypothetical protein
MHHGFIQPNCWNSPRVVALRRDIERGTAQVGPYRESRERYRIRDNVWRTREERQEGRQLLRRAVHAMLFGYDHIQTRLLACLPASASQTMPFPSCRAKGSADRAACTDQSGDPSWV